MRQGRWYRWMLTLGLALIALRLGYDFLFVFLTARTFAHAAPAAVEASRSASQKPSSTSEAKYRQLEDTIRAGNFDQALQFCERTDSGLPEGGRRAYLSWLYSETGQKEKAASCLRQGCWENAGDPSYPSHLVRFLVLRGMFREAVTAAEWGLNQDTPLPLSVHSALMELYFKQGNPSKLAQTVNDAMRVRAETSDFYYRTGRSMLRTGYVQEGIALLRKVLEVDPDANRAACLRLLVYACLSEGRTAEARSELELLDAADVSARGLLLMREGKWTEALKHYVADQHAPQRNPEEAVCEAHSGHLPRLRVEDDTSAFQDGVTLWAGRETGLRLLRVKRFEEAATAFLKADREQGLLLHSPSSRASPELNDDPGYPYTDAGRALVGGFYERYKAHRRAGWIGIQTRSALGSGETPPEVRGSLGVPVCRVIPGSPAAKAQVQAGDRISEMNGIAVNTESTWYAALDKVRPGQRIALTVQTETATRMVELTAGVRPD